ncbi:MAG: peptidoglycan-binding protein [Trichocoleus desertorum ATA4-8-CV12]|jgi:peptidoglycan hydrolase-like protein with peptidoglycan-binding domain|nr:peptidoglycan-binding protein [Trichocoleus desertorum ATA4-8-CV12]
MTFNIAALELPVLQNGSEGPAVGAWQSFLKGAQFVLGAVDEDFSRLTDTATRNYQQKNNLPATGVVDYTTYALALQQGFLFKVPNFSSALLLSYLNFGVAEVKDLQNSLNAIAQLDPPLTVDGDFGPLSSRGLAQVYKQRDVRFRDDLQQQLTATTKQKLETDFSAAIAFIDDYAKKLRFRLSGPHWVKFFLATNSIEDLASPFRQRAQAFEKALRVAGAKLDITNTLRPPERAYLMHFAAKISRSQIRPQDVTAMLGVDIDWVHYTNAGSVQAAQQMIDAYGIGTNPVALRSLHTQGLAIDWFINWEGTLQIRDSSGQLVNIGAPRNGENPTLMKVGASYGVYKLLGDPPHWSVNGG